MPQIKRLIGERTCKNCSKKFKVYADNPLQTVCDLKCSRAQYSKIMFSRLRGKMPNE